MKYIAVIDTETNWSNEVMSIGIAIAESGTFRKIDDMYFIFDPEYKVGGMYSMVLPVKEYSPQEIMISREKAMEKIKDAFGKYQVKEVFAYNASFDKRLLPELLSFRWFDIMRIAAYRQYNNKIPADVECCKTGKMKRNYGVEPMMHMLSGDKRYREVHNALYDAIDELEIMRLLGKTLEEYEVAEI